MILAAVSLVSIAKYNEGSIDYQEVWTLIPFFSSRKHSKISKSHTK